LPYLRSEASSTLRHFLRARHSLGSTSLEGRTGGVPRTFRPTSATQTSIHFLCCHPCSRRSILEQAFTRPLRGTRRFTPAEPALAGPLDSARAVRSRVSWRSSPLTPLSRSPLVTPASQPSVHLPDPPKMTSSRAAVKADACFRHPRRLPPVSIRAPTPSRRLPSCEDVSNPFDRGGTPPRSKTTSFASAGSCSPFLRSMRARCSREG